MQIKRLLIMLLFSSGTMLGYGQETYYNQQENFLKANSVWTFSKNLGINFNTLLPSSFISQTGDNMWCGASVADPKTGELLFYSDGMSVWNGNHNLMPNGNKTLNTIDPSSNKGNWYSSGQGVVIIPFINDTNRYYLFTLLRNHQGTFISSPSPKIHMGNLNTDLFYSVIDMRLDNGRGDVVDTLMNIPVKDSSFLSESMVAIPGDSCDVWLVVHSRYNPEFRAFRITEEGINETPVVSQTGFQLQGNHGLLNMASAYFKDRLIVSPNRKYL